VGEHSFVLMLSLFISVSHSFCYVYPFLLFYIYNCLIFHSFFQSVLVTFFVLSIINSSSLFHKCLFLRLLTILLISSFLFHELSSLFLLVAIAEVGINVLAWYLEVLSLKLFRQIRFNNILRDRNWLLLPVILGSAGPGKFSNINPFLPYSCQI
jgi:hypothetical protein